jgi:hypothetical protein
MSKVDEVNQNNLVVAGVGGICEQHDYQPTTDPEVAKCSECGMKMLVTQIVATIERPHL